MEKMEKKVEKVVEKKVYDFKLLNKFLNLFNRNGLNNPLLKEVARELNVTLPPYATFIKLNVALEQNVELNNFVKSMVDTVTTILDGINITTELKSKEQVKNDLEKSLVIVESLNKKYNAVVKTAGSKKTQSELMISKIDVSNGKLALKINKKDIKEKLNDLDLISKKEWGLI